MLARRLRADPQRLADHRPRVTGTLRSPNGGAQVVLRGFRRFTRGNDAPKTFGVAGSSRVDVDAIQPGVEFLAGRVFLLPSTHGHAAGDYTRGRADW